MNNNNQPAGPTIKYKSIAAIALIIIAISFNWSFVFGLLYIYWAVLDIITGHAYIVEDIYRSENPAIFWSIVGLWLLAGGYVLIDGLEQLGAL